MFYPFELRIREFAFKYRVLHPVQIPAEILAHLRYSFHVHVVNDYDEHFCFAILRSLFFPSTLFLNESTSDKTRSASTRDALSWSSTYHPIQRGKFCALYQSADMTSTPARDPHRWAYSYSPAWISHGQRETFSYINQDYLRYLSLNRTKAHAGIIRWIVLFFLGAYSVFVKYGLVIFGFFVSWKLLLSLQVFFSYHGKIT